MGLGLGVGVERRNSERIFRVDSESFVSLSLLLSLSLSHNDNGDSTLVLHSVVTLVGMVVHSVVHSVSAVTAVSAVKSVVVMKFFRKKIQMSVGQVAPSLADPRVIRGI